MYIPREPTSGFENRMMTSPEIQNLAVTVAPKIGHVSAKNFLNKVLLSRLAQGLV